MKSLILALSSLIAFSSTSFAEGFFCKEIEPKGAEQIQVLVVEGADIRSQLPWGKHYDEVHAAKVQIFVANGADVSMVQEFDGIAASEDVIYTISSQRKNGVTFRKYLDEDDQDYIVFTKNGQDSEHYLHCEYLD